MKTLVVGGAGFIGSHLCRKLVSGKNYVICIDDLSRGVKENIADLLKSDNFAFYCCDAADRKALAEIFEKEKPEQVYHLAANSDIQASALNPDVEYKNTFTTTYNVLMCMREYNVKKLFFSSTSAVYGDKRDVLLDEKTPELSPISYYGSMKLSSEAIISSFTYMNDFEVLIFRFPNVIGPNLTHGVIYDFIRKLKNNPKSLEILGNGKQTKPYIYVTDLIEAMIMFMDKLNSGVELYNLGVAGATSVTKIADIICEEMKLNDVEYCYTGGEGGWKGDVPVFKYCTDKINGAGWTAEFTSDEAVRNTVKAELSKEQ